MEEMLKVIFSNIFGFDIVIFVVACFNFLVFSFTMSKAKQLYSVLHPTARTSNKLSEAQLVEMRRSTASAYALYVNITGIFPQLGILGTVLALIEMSTQSENVQMNFSALTATFWGLVFVIFYKIIDAKVSAIIEDNEKNVAIYLERGKMPESKEEECISTGK